MGLAGPVLLFFEACAVGFLFGGLYDVFRILRLALPHGRVIVFLEDVLYFFLITVFSFTFLLVRAGGSLRAFLLLGELLGGVLYFFTLSLLVMRIANLIIGICKAILRFLYSITIRPVFRIFCWIGRQLRRLFCFVKRRILICVVARRQKTPGRPRRPAGIRKHFSFLCRKHLKTTGETVYNDIV